MEYELVAIASTEEDQPDFGYAIKKVEFDKLTSINILTYEEALAHVTDMNERALLRSFWPMPTDPEVQALIDNPDFCPVEYDEVDVPDLFASTLVYDTKPGSCIGTTERGLPLFGPDEVKYDECGEPIVNWMASTIVYKKERQPRRTQDMSRIEAASKQVARNRMMRHA